MVLFYLIFSIVTSSGLGVATHYYMMNSDTPFRDRMRKLISGKPRAALVSNINAVIRREVSGQGVGYDKISYEEIFVVLNALEEANIYSHSTLEDLHEATRIERDYSTVPRVVFVEEVFLILDAFADLSDSTPAHDAEPYRQAIWDDRRYEVSTMAQNLKKDCERKAVKALKSNSPKMKRAIS